MKKMQNRLLHIIIATPDMTDEEKYLAGGRRFMRKDGIPSEATKMNEAKEAAKILGTAFKKSVKGMMNDVKEIGEYLLTK